MNNKFYVTTPIYYVNDAPHLGTAYTTVAADAFGRQRALRGMDSRFLTGTDEHGLKIDRTAKERGQSPQEFVDEVSAQFRSAWPKLLCEPADFIRTTEERHKKVVQELWQKCADNGDIYKGDHEGWYCVSCEQFYPEKDLAEGNTCPTHKKVVEWTKEPTYFFRLSKYQDRLLKLYESRPEFVLPETRRNEVVAFVREGLKDLSVSRTSFKWGIQVPNDPEHVMYVWFDALTNYLSAVKDSEFAGFWPPDLQLVGKDIIRFHCIYWPAFLLSAGYSEDLLPKTIFAHGFLTINGQKMGKSTRNTVEPVRLAEYFGADEVRYFLLREIALGQDGDFSHKKLISRIRSELGSTLGNLLHRSLPFVSKHFGELVPAARAEDDSDREVKLRTRCAELVADAGKAWDQFEPHRALECAINLAIECNGYFDASAPWKLAKDPQKLAVLGTVIYHVLEVLRVCSVMLWPVLPAKSNALRAQLGLDPIFPIVGTDRWPLDWGGLVAGTKLHPGAPLFRNISKEEEEKILRDFAIVEPLVAGSPSISETEKTVPALPAQAKLAAVVVAPVDAAIAAPAAVVTAAPEGVALIQFDDFAKVELKVGHVLSAERIPKKDKLLKLSVDVGEASGPRQIIAGIALAYTPEQLVGKQIVIVANLAPRDFGKGLMSHGMLLACGDSDSLSIVTLEKSKPSGTRVK